MLDREAGWCAGPIAIIADQARTRNAGRNGHGGKSQNCQFVPHSLAADPPPDRAIGKAADGFLMRKASSESAALAPGLNGVSALISESSLA
ncbi:hypothetical protein D3Y57_00305 (plasmid) [Sphingomonas paeninsulae]|uniref:Uncharacterized protein n=1 Tax=Sphingomonas paeninsulae TaxID=2319844 RepID=A0A494TBM9_SPHPE|nr:hypothetical protein D3Y57_00305 [Sphingomonas paeninsulae]